MTAQDKAKNGERLSVSEALDLAQNAPLLELAQLANQRNLQLNGQRVAYLIDRNINYTNVCNAICRFCAFYRPKGHKEAYTLTFAELETKVKATLAQGGTQILLQGGVHPDYKIEFYEEMLKFLSQFKIALHAFSPPEIDYIAKNSNLTLTQTLTRLAKAGLQSIPGGGAEILVDHVRDRLAIGKCTAQEWLNVMEAAHALGIKSTSTMMLGHVETWKERIIHLEKLRNLQDATSGFLSFIPWTFQPEHTALHPKLKKNTDVHLVTTTEYLRVLAIARLFLDNFKHLQVSALTQGLKVAQAALDFGVDDMGSVMLEENVVSSAGCNGAEKLSAPLLIKNIYEAKKTPYQRDTFYNEVRPEFTQALVKNLILRFVA